RGSTFLQTLVVALVVRGELLVLGSDLPGELVQPALDRGELLLRRAQQCPGEPAPARRAVSRGGLPGGPLTRASRPIARGCAVVGPEPEVLRHPAGYVPEPTIEDRVLLVGDPLEQVPVVG